MAVATHCKRGHPLGGDNVRFAHGRRYCLTCKRRGDREWERRRRSGEMPVWLSAKPFTQWLHAHRPPEMTWQEWELRLGVPRGGLSHHVLGTKKRVHLDFADRILCTAGAHLRDVWPHLYPDEEVA